MCRLLFAVVSALLAVSTVACQHPSPSDPPELFSISPDQVKWMEIPDGNGRESADLFGDRSKQELFSYMIRWPPNTTFEAHTHPVTRYTMVLSGTFYYGHGNTFDTSKLEGRTR